MIEDIVELERRLAVALERIARGGERLRERADAPPAPPAPDRSGEIAQLGEALEAERSANAQLEERVRAVRRRQEETVAALQAEVAELRAVQEGFDATLERVRAINAQLRDNNRALREAAEAGVSDPGLINTAMAAELEALRLAREADREELDALLAELGRLLEEEKA